MYDIKADPHNIHNLANDPAYADVLKKMQKANHDYILETHDSGFMPESEMIARSDSNTTYNYVRSKNYSLEKILATAELATEGDVANLPELVKMLSDGDALVRYWAATGCVILKKEAMHAKSEILKLADDSSVAVTIAAAEALYELGDQQKAILILRKALGHSNSMARTHALNVIRLMGEDARPLLPIIMAMPGDAGPEDYDIRGRNAVVKMLEK